YVFDHWEIIGNVALDPDQYANPVTFTITCGGDLKAVFKPVECKVNFYTDPVGSNFNITFEGKVYVNGDMDTFPYGTSGLAYADCPPGYVFDHWEIIGNVALDPDQYANPVTFTITCGGDLKAVFKRIQCPVIFYTDPTGSGFNITFEGDIYFDGNSSTFLYGTSGLATANVPEGWMFDYWVATGNVILSSTTTNPTTVTVVCGGTLKAVYIQEGTGEFGTIGYWKHVFYVWKTGKGTFKDYVEAILVGYLVRINAESTVFSENYTLTMESAYNLLWTRDNDMRTRALKQCLASWLNWADGAVTPTQMVDINYDGHPDMTFSDAMTIAENILRNPNSTREELEHAKNICDSINNM
ncbi:MAG: hypothetical protein OEX77_10965, partial [Candidatus Bathyarchaeota archaeon]|nr:hypothetical protein [Candidatus Bathyarchaeota archaeon]